MKSTMTLLEMALAKHPATYWTKRLQLSRSALHMAKMRGTMSATLAGALAEELELDPQEWIVIAALENDRDSACKERMVRRFLGGAALTLGAAGNAVASTLKILCKVIESGKPKTCV